MTDLFSPHREAVVRSVERRFGSRELAEDAVQDALAAALASGETPANPKAWLHVVAHRRAVDALRGGREAPYATPPEVGAAADPFEVLALRERVRSVLGALHAIPRRQRDALVLRSFEDSSYDEIGARLEVGPDNAKQLVSRARRTLCTAVAAEALDCAAVRSELEAAVARSARAPAVVRPHLRACRECARCHADLRRAARRRRLGALVPASLFARLPDLLQRSLEVTAGTAAGRACAGLCVAAGAFATLSAEAPVVKQLAQAPVVTVQATPTPSPAARKRHRPRRTPTPAPTPIATPVRTPVATPTPPPAAPVATPAPSTADQIVDVQPAEDEHARAAAAAVHEQFEACRRTSGTPDACREEARTQHAELAAERRASG
ncbi:MAG TPA: RNA polymerase sigma factor [Solirubrobacter sp.]|nr:RNA polymerase sigma factor [Solirubrobacter sp.]